MFLFWATPHCTSAQATEPCLCGPKGRITCKTGLYCHGFDNEYKSQCKSHPDYPVCGNSGSVKTKEYCLCGANKTTCGKGKYCYDSKCTNKAKPARNIFTAFHFFFITFCEVLFANIWHREKSWGGTKELHSPTWFIVFQKNPPPIILFQKCDDGLKMFISQLFTQKNPRRSLTRVMSFKSVPKTCYLSK